MFFENGVEYNSSISVHTLLWRHYGGKAANSPECSFLINLEPLVRNREKCGNMNYPVGYNV